MTDVNHSVVVPHALLAVFMHNGVAASEVGEAHVHYASIAMRSAAFLQYSLRSGV